MYYSKVRLFLIVLFLGLGIFLHVQHGWIPAIYLYLGALLLLLTHFLFGNVWAAFSQLKKGNLLQAELLLQQIKRPQWLLKQPRAYYYFTQGIIALQNKNETEALPPLLKAADLGLRTDTDHALLLLNVAHIHYKNGDFNQAHIYAKRAAALPTNDLMIKENIEKLLLALNKN